MERYATENLSARSCIGGRAVAEQRRRAYLLPAGGLVDTAVKLIKTWLPTHDLRDFYCLKLQIRGGNLLRDIEPSMFKVILLAIFSQICQRGGGNLLWIIPG
jgi:hypothetical protein